MPTGMSGTVIDVQVFTREGIQRDKRAQAIIDAELKRYRQDLNDQIRIFDNDTFDRIQRMIVGQKSEWRSEQTGQRQSHHARIFGRANQPPRLV